MKEIDFYKPESQEAIDAIAKIDIEIREHVRKYSFCDFFGYDVPNEFYDDGIDIEDIDDFLERIFKVAREVYADEITEDDFEMGIFPTYSLEILFLLKGERELILRTQFEIKTIEELRKEFPPEAYSKTKSQHHEDFNY